MAIKYRKYKIVKDYKGVYNFLKEKSYSENFITNLRKSMNNIKINGITATTRTPLFVNDILEINANPNTKTTIMHCIIPLDIVYEDEYYLLINKPAGLSTSPSRSHYAQNLSGAICAYMDKFDPEFVLRIAGRLDKDTSGIVIVAKDSISMKELKILDKTYYAICEGVIDKDEIVDKKILTITENGVNKQKREISPLGKEAKTFVHPIKNDGQHTLIRLNLEHGRTHQIRVHLASIGHPLVGDTLYGKLSLFINRCALHCREIKFYHYIKKEEIVITTPLPKDFFL